MPGFFYNLNAVGLSSERITLLARRQPERPQRLSYASDRTQWLPYLAALASFKPVLGAARAGTGHLTGGGDL